MINPYEIFSIIVNEVAHNILGENANYGRDILHEYSIEVFQYILNNLSIKFNFDLLYIIVTSILLSLELLKEDSKNKNLKYFLIRILELDEKIIKFLMTTINSEV